MFVGLIVMLNINVLVNGLNEALIGQSMIYGLSYLAGKERNSTICQKELGLFYSAIEHQTPWSLKVLDASGGPGPGFFYGNNLWLGSYAQCQDLRNKKPLEVNHEIVKHSNSTPYDYPPYNLKFFVAHFEHNNTIQYHTQLPLEFTIQIGLCAPESCSPDDFRPLLVQHVSHRLLTFQKFLNLDLNLTLVRTVEPAGLWLLQFPETIILLAIVVAILFLNILGTYYGIKEHKFNKNLVTGQRGKQGSEPEYILNSSTETEKSTTLGEIIKCFSFHSNVKSLVNTNLPADSVTTIHGLKFFGMLWVIMVHAVFYQADFLENVPIAYRLSEDFFAQIFSNSTYSVDTFLFLSGFLLAYLFFTSTKKNLDSYLKKVVQFFMMFLNRFLRLTPPYIFVILWSSVMYTYYRKASVLYSHERNDELCSMYWWRNLLYINNLFPRSEMCLSWSWYLSVDTQFFIIGTILLLLSTIKFTISAIFIVLLLIGNILATSYTSYSIKYIPTMDEQLRQLDAIYDLPYHRIGPYLIGMITAYIFVNTLEKKLKLRERTRIVLWILFPLLNLWVLFTLYTRNLSVEFSAVYMGISRTLWGVGLGWLLIACCTGNAPLLEAFLSFPGWIPLSRLTYCAYLLNPLVANMFYMSANSGLNASKASFAVTIQGVAFCTYLLAFFLSVLIESPSILLTKLLFKKLLKQK